MIQYINVCENNNSFPTKKINLEEERIAEIFETLLDSKAEIVEILLDINSFVILEVNIFVLIVGLWTSEKKLDFVVDVIALFSEEVVEVVFGADVKLVVAFDLLVLVDLETLLYGK